MATHTGALGLSAFAYVYARRHAHDENYAFGTGKVGDLAGFSSALLLAWCPIGRMLRVPIANDWAISAAYGR